MAKQMPVLRQGGQIPCDPAAAGSVFDAACRLCLYKKQKAGTVKDKAEMFGVLLEKLRFSVEHVREDGVEKRQLQLVEKRTAQDAALHQKGDVRERGVQQQKVCLRRRLVGAIDGAEVSNRKFRIKNREKDIQKVILHDPLRLILSGKHLPPDRCGGLGKLAAGAALRQKSPL